MCLFASRLPTFKPVCASNFAKCAVIGQRSSPDIRYDHAMVGMLRADRARCDDFEMPHPNLIRSEERHGIDCCPAPAPPGHTVRVSVSAQESVNAIAGRCIEVAARDH